jgi:hypothetical protein
MANELTSDQIAALLSGTRSKGEYDRVLDEFLNSDAVGVMVAQADTDDKPIGTGEFASKTIAQLATGLNNARTRPNKDTGKPAHPGGNKVKVIKRKVKNDDGTEGYVVGLVNLAKYGQNGDGATEEAETE